ncbi:NTP transferase domain-containing protein [Sphingomonas piscis]|nr:NTP transferase domain-containing protein [Sphingomonas piscis]
MRWHAVVLAGSRPGGDPFALSMGANLKALIPVNGVPMVRHPVEALLNCDAIATVTVLAQEAERIAATLPEDKRLQVRTSAGTIAETLLSLCDDPETVWPLLVTTADHALLTPEMVRDVCWKSTRSDVGIGVVSKRRLLGRFPDTKRTWIPFKGGSFTGANLFVLRSDKVRTVIEVWRSVEQDRKKVGKLLWSLGPSLFFQAALRRLTIEELLHKISVRLGVSIRAVRLSDPLAAIDVDKPSDHQQVEAILAGRQ